MKLFNNDINSSSCCNEMDINAFAIECPQISSSSASLSSSKSSSKSIANNRIKESDDNVISKMKYCYCCLPEDEGKHSDNSIYEFIIML